MTRRRRLGLLVVACLLALTAPAVAPASAASAPFPPLLTEIRAAHHPGFDRVVFEFFGGVPTTRRAEYVSRIVNPAGNEVPVAGRAILQMTFTPARGHNEALTFISPKRATFALPNVLTAVQGEDFEAVLVYGIGLAKREPFRVSTLSNPPRVVLDIETGFSWVNRPVWFVDQNATVRSVLRPIATSAPAHGLMDRLFAGPTAAERSSGLRFVASRATDYQNLTVSTGAVARVQLVGGCSSGGSTVTIANEIMPTLRRLPNVSWVKVYDPAGRTERPTGQVDSIPVCLEP
jgi:Sporulation and spore germination